MRMAGRSHVDNLQGPALVVAPHNDDEVLAAAGAVQRHRALGQEIRVVLLTNGDGQYRGPLSNHRLAVQLGYRRQEETLHALSHLGVGDDDVDFLGYPDRGLPSMWDHNWSPDVPYRSPRTGATASPYANSHTLQAPYCGHALVEDLIDIIGKSAPRTLYLPHPNDLHPDHWAAHAFTMFVLEGLERQGLPRPRLWAYVVHRGRWPLPRGKRLAATLSPPPALEDLDTQWHTLPLTPEERERKFHAILRHKSQLRYMRRYMVSFARSNELFGAIPRLSLGTALNIPDSEDAWASEAPRPSTVDEEPMISYTDPRRRSLLRDLKRYNDIRALHLQCTSSGRLVIEIELFDRLRPTNHIMLHLRPFSERASYPEPTRLMAKGGSRHRRRNPRASHPRSVRFEVPEDALQDAQALMLGAELQRNGITFAKAAYRVVDLSAKRYDGCGVYSAT